MEAVAIAAFSLGAGLLGDAFGLRSVFLWVLVVLVLVDGIFLTLLYRTYATDVALVQNTLEDRRRTALAELPGKSARTGTQPGSDLRQGEGDVPDGAAGGVEESAHAFAGVEEDGAVADLQMREAFREVRFEGVDGV